MSAHAAETPEQVIVETRQHWLSAGLWWRLLLYLVAAAVTIALLATQQARIAASGLPVGPALLVIDVVLFVLLVLRPYVLWHSQVYRLTNHRLVLEEGVLVRRSKSIPLARVQDITSEIGPLGRLLGYGSLRVENAGESPGFDLLRDIPHPARFRDLLLEHAADARASTI